MALYKKLQIINFLQKEKLSVVDIKLLKDLTGLKNKQSLASCLDSLVKNKVLQRAERGKYLVTSNLENDFLIANLLYEPSYVSLETALNLYGILPQFPTEISSITSKRKKTKKAAGKIYTYCQVDLKYFWGFGKKEGALIASPEKALLDIIYLSSKGVKKITIDELNLSKINKKLFYKFSQSYSLGQKYKNILNMILKK